MTGALMFITFMSDLIKWMNVLKFVMYANYVTILFSSETSNAAYQNMITELTHFEKNFKLIWLNSNVTKPKYISFHAEQKTVPQHNFSISMSGGHVVKFDDARILGVFINKHMKWKSLPNHAANKIAKFVALPYRKIYCLKDYYQKFSYKSLISAKFIYCVPVQGNSSNSTMQIIVLLQNELWEPSAMLSPDKHHILYLTISAFLKLTILTFNL